MLNFGERLHLDFESVAVRRELGLGTRRLQPGAEVGEADTPCCEDDGVL